MGREDSDAMLAAAAGRGDRAAFGELLKRHYKRIHGLAWRLTGSRADADDVAQEVCCRLVERIAGFRGEARFTTWLCGIVYNECRDLRRRHRSFLGFAERFAVLMRPSDDRDPHDAAWLKSAIARLKPALRDAVILVAGEQLTHAEAAAILGVAETTISWRMHEVRRLFARQDIEGER